MKKFNLIAFLSLFIFIVEAQAIILEEFAIGLNQPVDITNAGGDDLYVAERVGRIQQINASGVVGAAPFLDITDRVLSDAGERGLLGIVFHPNFPDSSYIYCNYTGIGGATFVSRFDVMSTVQANSTSELILLSYDQPFQNHNGGDLEFDDEGYLLIASGDGGSGGDPQNNAQNLSSYLGKILRIDVDNGTPYSIPNSNPFVGQSGLLGEIYAYGLRNPWRIAYDDMTDALYVGDVGQNAWEEVTKIADGISDPNCGWRCYEGNNPYNLSMCDTNSAMSIPALYDYAQKPGGGCTGSITGGRVYRGSDMWTLYGKYIYADYCTGFIAALDVNTAQSDTIFSPSSIRFTTFGEDAEKELYTVNVFDGKMYKLQSSLQNDFVFTIDLDGAQAGTSSTGEGYGIATFDSTSRRLTVSGLFYGLTGNPTASHVHKAQAGSNGGVIFGLSRTSLGADSLAFYGSGVLTAGQTSDLLVNDGFYVNIHSSTNGAGEIRGQIIRVNCPTNYDAHAPRLPLGGYPVNSTSIIGALNASDSMSVIFESSAELKAGFETELGATLEVIQAACP